MVAQFLDIQPWTRFFTGGTGSLGQDDSGFGQWYRIGRTQGWHSVAQYKTGGIETQQICLPGQGKATHRPGLYVTARLAPNEIS